MKPTALVFVLMSSMLLLSCDSQCADCSGCGIAGGPAQGDQLWADVGHDANGAPSIWLTLILDGHCNYDQADSESLRWAEGAVEIGAAIEMADRDVDSTDGQSSTTYSFDGLDLTVTYAGPGIGLDFVPTDGAAPVHVDCSSDGSSIVCSDA